MDLTTAGSIEGEAIVNALETEHLTQIVELFEQARND
jgi:hypothetical protein